MPFTEYHKSMQKFLIDLAWMHLKKTGVRIEAENLSTSIDVETLILWCAVAGKYDSRIVKSLAGWLAQYEYLVSVDRLSQIIACHQERAIHISFINSIINSTLTGSQKKRWQTFLNTNQNTCSNRMALNPGVLQRHDLILKDNILFQLRAFMGSFIKADVLYLILIKYSGARKSDALFSASSLQRELKYDLSAIFKVLKTFQLAGIIKKTDTGRQDRRNTFYILSADNPFFGRLVISPRKNDGNKQLFSERRYIDWSALLNIAMVSDELILYSREVQKKNNQDEFTLIIKNKMGLLIDRIHQLNWTAGIVIDLKKIKIDKLEEMTVSGMAGHIEECFKGIKKFLMN